ncbi:AAA family ATPase [Planococcus liqunii]|uniref:AAA family ATPase n=1 Tax=Planococcus liqunii TaxID=3058394 RepID=UPI00262FFB0A|nr:AAA family ATPase [Planococcus sp. N056]WKA51710.1 AAA family ATPase [Planococcus sp. N056]
MIKLVNLASNYNSLDKNAIKKFKIENELKCNYCESKFLNLEALNIDYLVPKTLATKIFENTNNLICICHSCNMNKGARFPVSRDKEMLLLNPYIDEPEEHFLYDASGMIFSNTEKGNVTINTFNLNRNDLLRRRKDELLKFHIKWKRASITTGKLIDSIDDKSQFAGMKRYFLKKWKNNKFNHTLEIKGARTGRESALKNESNYSFRRTRSTANIKHNKSLWLSKKFLKKHIITIGDLNTPIDRPYIDAKMAYRKFQTKNEQYDLQVKNERTLNYYTKNRLIERVEISNFKGIKYLDIFLPGYQEEKTPWLMLLGENGTGKSSILKAISLTLMGEDKREELKLRASQFLKSGEEEGYISLYLSGSLKPVTLHFKKDSERFYGTDIKAVKVLLLAYGSTRILSDEINEDATRGFTIKIENMFNPYASLNNIKAFFGKITEKEFVKTADLLISLLSLGNEYKFVRERENIFLKDINENKVALRDLSDGFQSMIALASDIIIVMRQYWDEIEKAEGIVLIDELDLHLHPQWKMKIVTQLRRVFPRIQFICTTHDPLCLRGLNSNEINVINKIDGEVYLIKNLPDIEGMQIDQILTADYFGLYSTYSTYFNGLFKKYYELLNKPEKTQDEKKEIVDISQVINKSMVLGNNKREQILLSTIDNYVAEGTNRLMSSDLETTLKDKLLNILDPTKGDASFDKD